MLLNYWRSEFDNRTGNVGGLPLSIVANILGNSLDYETITSPGEGDGKLYVYSKHYVSITGYDAFTGYDNLTVCILNKTTPEAVSLAPAASEGQYVSNGSHHYSTTTGVAWTSGQEPEFVQAYGWSEAILISTGSIAISTGIVATTPFWIKREFSENYEITGESNIIFGFSADPT